MCGFCGFINFEKKDNEKLNTLILKKMLSSIDFRGPDNSGIWKHKSKIFFGHNRLSILDLSEKGSQPMISQNERFVIIYNGEIYNHLELRKSIEEKKNIFFKGFSDTETILEFVNVFGIKESLTSFRGMFSFALYDKYENKLFLARDSMGEKPIYYGFNSNFFYFGSDQRSFFKSEKFKPEIDYDSVSLFLKYGFIPDPNSIIKNIFKLNKGHYLELDLISKKTKLNSYKIQNLKNYESFNFKSENNCVNELENLLNKSVKSQLISDVDVGCFLSGGTDSTLISLISSKLSNSKINTFSIGFEDKEYDESYQAREISNLLKTNHHEFVLKNKEIEENIFEINDVFSEPFADSSQIPTMILSKFASQKNKVVLTGDGADELFGGYNRYLFINYFTKYIKKIPLSFRKRLANLIRKKKGIPLKIILSSINFILLNNKQTEINTRINKFFSFFESKDENELYDLLLQNNYEYNQILKNPIYKKLSLDKYEKHWSLEFMRRDIENYLNNDILVKVDRSTMYSSLEARAPYLDQDIINFSNQLPFEMKIKRNKKKYLLSKLLKKLMPSYNLNYPKKGFSIPIDRIFRNNLKNFIFNLINKDIFYEDNFLNKDQIINLYKEHQENRKNNSFLLWNVIIYFLWREKYKI